ncbi:arginine N-methyltransferase [Plasmodium falciparum IGH-CR14]|uniref:Arginine N-methyltransferase n=1 Tax=Plasmodium falciparum IGH-CR14 TaxID=580059 RepID=A0A0L1I6A4_PLAFA|nr:arginine N-methyltransferase [Plasmodium falciparum IGH-CR14]
MTIKNKYGYLKLGIEIEYHKIPQCEENNIDPDFFACKLFSDNTKNIYNELTTNESLNNSSMINGNGKRCSYEIDPLFGNIYEDKNIWEKNIYGLMSTWINPDDENENSSLYSMDALNKELQWSTYISIKEWKNVKVIHSDIRYLDIPKKADIIISELLGSFGDNELFPECMDGIKKFLKDDGISIPMNCVSYLEPISCSALYHKVMENNISGGNESFYVVNMYSYTKISQESSKECFFFQVPPIHTKQDNSHNYRYKNINFKIKMDTYIHGFLCYFKSQLYDDVYISIEPKTHTPNLHSWFPLYIPINKIQFLKKGQNLSFSIWRLTDHQKIWYEWCINEPITTSIHNYNARYFSIGR